MGGHPAQTAGLEIARRRRSAPVAQPSPSQHRWWPWLLALAGLTLLVLGRALFAARPVFLSNEYSDLASQFIDWRAFGFGELRRGHLPLWNPHLFSGAPYFGGFQSALLYPPNLFFLLLPLHQAVNWSIALHIFLAGGFTYWWAASRGLRAASCFLAATMFMFCGAHFFHVYAGHLSNLCALIWAPLIFLTIDRLVEAPSLRWSLIGASAATMQVLAGHPQYVFYTAIAAAIYSVMRLRGAQHRTRSAICLAGIVLGAVGLSAIQLFTGFQESRELARKALTYDFAAQFSLPPENLLTLVAPGLFGPAAGYWGRGYLWEGCVFVGVAGALLAIAGGLMGNRDRRQFSVTMAVVLLLLALGANTPLFTALYHGLPGFDHFRGTSKFIALASLFVSMLAAIGLERLIEERRVPRGFLGGVIVAGALSLLAALAVQGGAGEGGWWHSAMLAARATGETLLPPDAYADPAFVAKAAQAAWRSLLVTGALFFVVAFLLWSLPRYRWASTLLLAGSVAELVVFALVTVDTSELRRPEVTMIKNTLDARAGRGDDYRILNLINPNAALSLGAQDVWGYDPAVLSRYAELAAAIQGLDPDKASQDVTFTHDHPLLGMLRCRFIFFSENGRFKVSERASAAPHVLLVARYRRLQQRNDILAALTASSFDPAAETILEDVPNPEPVASVDPGTARIVESSTDSLTIAATVKSPSVLLVTDAYAAGWRAHALPGSSQQNYQVLPANYALRAIPLGTGEHRLRLEYLPSGFIIGRWVSGISLVVFLGLTLMCVRRT